MDLKDYLLELFQFLRRLLLCQKCDSNVAAQFVGNSHSSMELYINFYGFLEVAIVSSRCYAGVTSMLIKHLGEVVRSRHKKLREARRTRPA